MEYEKVQVVDIDNGSRFETYTIAGEPGSGVMCLNGAAARQVQVGDHIINLNWNPKVNQQIMDQVGIDILHRKRELPY